MIVNNLYVFFKCFFECKMRQFVSAGIRKNMDRVRQFKKLVTNDYHAHSNHLTILSVIRLLVKEEAMAFRIILNYMFQRQN
jgi:hypothetical protein